MLHLQQGRVRGPEKLCHPCRQGEVYEEGHSLSLGHLLQELQDGLVERGQPTQDAPEKHPKEQEDTSLLSRVTSTYRVTYIRLKIDMWLSHLAKS